MRSASWVQRYSFARRAGHRLRRRACPARRDDPGPPCDRRCHRPSARIPWFCRCRCPVQRCPPAHSRSRPHEFTGACGAAEDRERRVPASTPVTHHLKRMSVTRCCESQATAPPHRQRGGSCKIARSPCKGSHAQLAGSVTKAIVTPTGRAACTDHGHRSTCQGSAGRKPHERPRA